MQERKVSQAPDLFSSAEMGPLKVKNRVVMAPLTRSRAGPGNVPTQLNALYYAQRANAGSWWVMTQDVALDSHSASQGCWSGCSAAEGVVKSR